MGGGFLKKTNVAGKECTSKDECSALNTRDTKKRTTSKKNERELSLNSATTDRKSTNSTVTKKASRAKKHKKKHK